MKYTMLGQHTHKTIMVKSVSLSVSQSVRGHLVLAYHSSLTQQVKGNRWPRLQVGKYCACAIRLHDETDTPLLDSLSSGLFNRHNTNSMIIDSRGGKLFC